MQQTILKSDEKLREMLFSNIDVKNEKVVVVDEPTTVLLKTELDDADVDDASSHDDVISSASDNIKYELKLCDSKCIVCGLKIEDGLLTVHMQEHFQAEQICDICGVLCDNVKAFRTHLLENHEIVLHKCGKCNLTFQYKSLYNIHMDKAHPDNYSKLLLASDNNDLLSPSSSVNDDDIVPSSKEMKNKIVKLGIRSKKAINYLISSDPTTKFDEYKCNPASLKKACPICNAQITSGNLKKHMSNHTSGPQICEICGATLRSYESLRGHMFYSHKSRSYTCDQCGKKFTKKYPFELHKRKEHTGEKSHVCDTCGKSFFTLYYLNKHIKMTHLKLRPYVCKYCKRGFSSRFALKTHERQHTNEAPYKCEICGDGFRQNVSLRAHRKSKHNIIEATPCICKVCGKAFGCDQAIKSHMRLH